MTYSTHICLLAALSLVAIPFFEKTHAQAPGVRIFEQSSEGLDKEEDQMHEQIKRLVEAKKTLSPKQIQTQLATPQATEVKLIPASKTPLKPADIATRAHKSYYRVGIVYLCGNCDIWHSNLGAGYAISDDGVIATCSHVLQLDKGLKNQTLIAIDPEGKVHPIQSIIANHEKMDGAIVKIDAKTTPLAFNTNVRPGESSYCLSRPLDQIQYFSAGIINRFYWQSTRRGNDPNSLKALSQLRLNVSTSWAPGSSGAPILDSCANVIGHVSEIEPLGDDPPEGGAENDKNETDFYTLMTLHIAIPAKPMQALANIPAKAKTSSTLKP